MSCDCQLIIKENDDDDVVVPCIGDCLNETPSRAAAGHCVIGRETMYEHTRK